MKKRVLASILCLSMVVVLFAGTSLTATAVEDNWSNQANRDTAWSDGAISTPQQLAQFAYLVNRGAYKGTGEVWLTQDVNLAGKEWTAIGFSGGTNRIFSGVFDGNGYTVKNMQLSNFLSSSDAVRYDGLFGKTNGTIQNVTVTGTAVTQGSTQRVYMGAIAGANIGGTIFGCVGRLEMNMVVSGVSYIGGIVGANRGEILRCINESDLKIQGKNTNVGGISASSDGSQGGAVIDRCINYGNITGQAFFIAGIVAYAFEAPCVITNSYNQGNISALTEGNAAAGGIAGYYNGSRFGNCYNTGILSAANSGGLIGDLNGSAASSISNSYYMEGSSALGVFKVDNTPVSAENDIGSRMREAEMKGQAFVDALNGGETVFIVGADGYPAIAPRTVAFQIKVMPSDAFVSVSAGGTKLSPEADGSYNLLPGDYLIEAGAANYQTESFIHTVTYDRATQLITITLRSLLAEEEPANPPTGESDVLLLWFLLVFLSGGCVVKTLYSRNSAHRNPELES